MSSPITLADVEAGVSDAQVLLSDLLPVLETVAKAEGWDVIRLKSSVFAGLPILQPVAPDAGAPYDKARDALAEDTAQTENEG